MRKLTLMFLLLNLAGSALATTFTPELANKLDVSSDNELIHVLRLSCLGVGLACRQWEGATSARHRGNSRSPEPACRSIISRLRMAAAHSTDTSIGILRWTNCIVCRLRRRLSIRVGPQSPPLPHDLAPNS